MMRFVRAYAMRVVIGAVLLTAAYGVVLAYVVYHTFQREQKIVRNIQAQRGAVGFVDIAPDWITQPIRDRAPFFNRIQNVVLTGNAKPSELISELKSLQYLKYLRLDSTRTTDAELEQLKGLRSLEWLDLDNTEITDVGLEHLKGLTRLTRLDLFRTRVTDDGLVHLKGIPLERLFLYRTKVTDAGLEHLTTLKSLQWLYLDDTQVTAEGRAMLRKALPNCKIFPDT